MDTGARSSPRVAGRGAAPQVGLTVGLGAEALRDAGVGGARRGEYLGRRRESPHDSGTGAGGERGAAAPPAAEARCAGLGWAVRDWAVPGCPGAGLPGPGAAAPWRCGGPGARLPQRGNSRSSFVLGGRAGGAAAAPPPERRPRRSPRGPSPSPRPGPGPGPRDSRG